MESRPSKDGAIRQHVAKSTASNLIGQAVILGTGFLLAPFVLREIGPADYGLWILVNSLTGYASVLEFGISTAVIKYVAEHRARGEREQAAALVATALSLYTVLGLLAIVFSVLLSLLLPQIIDIAAADQAKAARLVLLAGVGLGISIPATIVVAVLRGLQRFDLLNLFYIFNTLLSAGATIGVLLLGWGVLGIAAAGIPVTIVSQVPGLLLIHRADPEMRLGWRGARRSLVRTVTGFSFSLFVIQIARQLQMRTDEVIIAGTLPISAVTPYSFGRRLGEIPNQFANQFIRTLMPLASGLHADQDWARLRGMFVASSRLAVAISAPLAVILSVLAPSVLTLWIGTEYAQYWPVVLLVSLSSVVVVSQYPAGALLQGMARHHILAATSIATGIINVALSLILVRQMGVIGVAVGTFVPAVLSALVIAPYTLRLLHVRPSELIRDAWLPALAPLAPTIAVAGALQSVLQPSSFIMLGVIASVAGLVYLLTYFIFRATATERDLFRGVLVRAVNLARTSLRP